MAGASKRRAKSEKKSSDSSDRRSPDGSEVQKGSTPKSIPRLDGQGDGQVDARKDAPITYSNERDLKNISDVLGMAGWYIARGFEIPEGLPLRPAKFNNFGREISVNLNTFNLVQHPDAVAYQYDVSWGGETDATKRMLVKKLWASKAVKTALGEPQGMWIYDGNKLAWSSKELPRSETRIQVDLDAEEAQAAIAAGKKPRNRAPGSKKNVHTVYVKFTRKVDFRSVTAFLNGQIDWSNECIDTINFLDHVLREQPSRNYTQIKKSFFQRGEKRFDLGGGIEAFKGVFSSLRPVLNDQYQKGLSINVDVANGTFWRPQELLRSIMQVFGCTVPQFQQRFKEAKNARDGYRNSYLKKDLTRFRRIGVTAFHNKGEETQWTLDEIVGKDCHEATFADPDDKRDVKNKDKKQISVYDYFKSKYNLDLMSNVPVAKMTKKIRGGDVYLPIEFLKIDPNQRYNSKLSDQQTSQMIKFAVTLPKERRAAIEHGVKLLDWAQDPYLKHYGIKVNPNPSRVKARILPLPQLNFGPVTKPVQVDPKDLTMGRWRLDGKKFIMPNDRPISSWGVVVVSGAGRGPIPSDQVRVFIDHFIKVFEGHGGRIMAHPKFGKRPYLTQGQLSDGGEMMAKAYNGCGNHYNSRPMFMVFIVNDRNAEAYRRIKKSMDCRFGVPSQVLQSRHVATNSAQYISNVCLKVNAKLGGATSWARSAHIPKVAPKSASTPTMVIGADVSHPAPGAGSDEKASFAAITVSKDQHFTRYWAQVQTNGSRVEMVTSQNIKDHLGDMAKRWIETIGKGNPPERVLYIRDGVSEGQYAAVLAEEVRDMKATFSMLGCKTIPKFTVVIAGKRHHIRFFPEKGDRNGNPIPGTLVEAGCTHPFEFDFYLCSHVAIKGTARPIHYQVICNEGNWDATELQNFLFEHSFQYARSTTPVSLHPAVYYAHLAADRARAHVNENPVSSGKKEAKADQQSSTGTSSKQSVEIRPLTEMSRVMNLQDVMWYI